MNITKNDAKSALHAAGKSEEYSLTLYHYEMASPYLLLWGILWIIAGIISALSPDNTKMAWLIVDTVGIVVTGYLVVGDARRFDKYNARSEWLRFMAAVVVLVLFIAATLAIFSPVSDIQIQSFITMLIAMIYMILGFWTGYRLTVIGAVLACLVTGTLIYTPSQLPLTISVLGGTALILGGLWMRRA